MHPGWLIRAFALLPAVLARPSGSSSSPSTSASEEHELPDTVPKIQRTLSLNHVPSREWRTRPSFHALPSPFDPDRPAQATHSTTPARLQELKSIAHDPRRTAAAARQHHSARPFHRTLSLSHEPSTAKGARPHDIKASALQRPSAARRARVQGVEADRGRAPGRRYRLAMLGERLSQEHARALPRVDSALALAGRRYRERLGSLRRLRAGRRSASAPTTTELERAARRASDEHVRETEAAAAALRRTTAELDARKRRHETVVRALESPRSPSPKRPRARTPLRELQHPPGKRPRVHEAGTASSRRGSNEGVHPRPRSSNDENVPPGRNGANVPLGASGENVPPGHHAATAAESPRRSESSSHGSGSPTESDVSSGSRGSVASEDSSTRTVVEHGGRSHRQDDEAGSREVSS